MQQAHSLFAFHNADLEIGQSHKGATSKYPVRHIAVQLYVETRQLDGEYTKRLRVQ